MNRPTATSQGIARMMSKTYQEESRSTAFALGVDAQGRPVSKTIPIITGHGQIEKLTDQNRTLYVSGHDVGFPDLIIKTTENSLNECLTIPKDEAKQVFTRVWDAIKNQDLDKIYKKKKKWTDFCDDVVLFLCLRQILFKTPIPVCANPPTS